jgi:hypothetical protein
MLSRMMMIRAMYDVDDPPHLIWKAYSIYISQNSKTVCYDHDHDCATVHRVVE